MRQSNFLLLAQRNGFNECLVYFIFQEILTKVGIRFVKAVWVQVPLIEKLEQKSLMRYKLIKKAYLHLAHSLEHCLPYFDKIILIPANRLENLIH